MRVSPCVTGAWFRSRADSTGPQSFCRPSVTLPRSFWATWVGFIVCIEVLLGCILLKNTPPFLHFVERGTSRSWVWSWKCHELKQTRMSCVNISRSRFYFRASIGKHLCSHAFLWHMFKVRSMNEIFTEILQKNSGWLLVSLNWSFYVRPLACDFSVSHPSYFCSISNNPQIRI